MPSRLRTIGLVTIVTLGLFVAGIPGIVAGGSAPDRTVGSNTVAPGETVQISVSVTTDSDGGKLSISESFSPSSTGVDVSSFKLNGTEDNSGYIPYSSNNGLTVITQEIPAHTTVTLTYDVTAPTQAGVDFNITGEITGTGVGGETLSVSKSTIPVMETPPKASLHLKSASAAPGNSVLVEVTVEHPRDGLTLNNSVSGPVADVSVQNVTVDEHPVDPSIQTSDSNKSLITLSGLSVSNTAKATLNIAVAADANPGQTLNVTGTVTTRGLQLPLDEHTISVVESNVVDRYDTENNGVDFQEFATAAKDYANNALDFSELVEMAEAYANSAG